MCLKPCCVFFRALHSRMPEDWGFCVRQWRSMAPPAAAKHQDFTQSEATGSSVKSVWFRTQCRNDACVLKCIGRIDPGQTGRMVQSSPRRVLFQCCRVYVSAFHSLSFVSGATFTEASSIMVIIAHDVMLLVCACISCITYHL